MAGVLDGVENLFGFRLRMRLVAALFVPRAHLRPVGLETRIRFSSLLDNRESRA